APPGAKPAEKATRTPSALSRGADPGAVSAGSDDAGGSVSVELTCASSGRGVRGWSHPRWSGDGPAPRVHTPRGGRTHRARRGSPATRAGTGWRTLLL